MSYLMCPICRSGLVVSATQKVGDEVLAGQLACGSGHTFAIRQGVVDFGAREHPKCNTWSQTYARHDFGELDRRVRESKTPAQLEKEQLAFQDMVDRINRLRPECIVDIGTGRGMFLLALLEGLAYRPTIVCLDRSVTVLTCDRLKVREKGTSCRVNCLAADITCMPLRDSSVPLIASYSGLANMDAGTVPRGLAEAHRVLAEGGCLLDGTMILKPGSASVRALEDFWASQGEHAAGNYFSEADIVTIYEDSPFGAAELNVLYEAIGEPNDDLVPVEGDWFAGVTAIARK